jgi:hypothetical protein
MLESGVTGVVMDPSSSDYVRFGRTAGTTPRWTAHEVAAGMPSSLTTS